MHNGTRSGFLYRVAETIGADDVYLHPASSMAPGKEWLTARALRLERIGPVAFVDGERLTKEELSTPRTLIEQRTGG